MPASRRKGGYQYYGVRVGRVPGVYESWPECEAQVSGFHRSVDGQVQAYKGFNSRHEAEEYVRGGSPAFATAASGRDAAAVAPGVGTGAGPVVQQQQHQQQAGAIPVHHVHQTPPRTIFPRPQPILRPTSPSARFVPYPSRAAQRQPQPPAPPAATATVTVIASRVPPSPPIHSSPPPAYSEIADPDEDEFDDAWDDIPEEEIARMMEPWERPGHAGGPALGSGRARHPAVADGNGNGNGSGSAPVPAPASPSPSPRARQALRSARPLPAVPLSTSSSASASHPAHRNPTAASASTLTSRPTNPNPTPTPASDPSLPYIAYTDGCCLDNGRPTARAGMGVHWAAWFGPGAGGGTASGAGTGTGTGQGQGQGRGPTVAERVVGRQTNQRAELGAIIRALELCPEDGRSIEIRTDSAYSISCVTTWLHKWRREGKLDSNYQGRDPVKNLDLVLRILELVDRRKAHGGGEVKFVKVVAHVGIEGNEIADGLAKEGAMKQGLL